MKKNNLVFVEWMDTVTIFEWYSPDNISDVHPTVVHSVGWLVHEDKFSITLASTISQTTGLFSLIACIPKGCIITHHDLELPEEVKKTGNEKTD